MQSKPPPPTYLNTFLALAIGLHFVLPIKRIIHSPNTYFGFIFIVFGIVLNVWSSRLTKKKSTAIHFYEAPNRLVIAIAAFTWRVYNSVTPYGWV